MPVKVFFCYAHEDHQLLKKLKAHLKALQHQGFIDIWYDRDINAGKEWKQEIVINLNNADIVLLLVSPSFMASDYCYSVELQQVLERHKRGEATVIPIILRPVYWQIEPFNKLQALPKNSKPVMSRAWRNADEAFSEITIDIYNSIITLPKRAKVGPADTILSSSLFPKRGGNKDTEKIPKDEVKELSSDFHTNYSTGWKDDFISSSHVINHEQDISDEPTLNTTPYISLKRIAFLYVKEGKEPGKIYEIKESLQIGRRRESDIFLEDLEVSRFQASIYVDMNGNYILSDLGSANGTKVNDLIIKRDEKYTLKEGDEIYMGKTILAFASKIAT